MSESPTEWNNPTWECDVGTKLHICTCTCTYTCTYIQHEHCISFLPQFGGSDVLHVYNKHQLKHRLSPNSLYVVSMRASGFTMEVTNSLSGTVTMVGVRVMVGHKSIEKAPSFVEVFGRAHQVIVWNVLVHDPTLTCRSQGEKNCVMCSKYPSTLTSCSM